MSSPTDKGDKGDKGQNLMSRVRAMPLGEAMRLAKSTDPQERIALERLHGKLAWEPLLRNPGLSAPEVSRIASMGTLPGPLMDLILANPGWLSNEQVRRALLTSPVLKGQAVNTVLRYLSKNELELCVKQASYPYNVRTTAKRMLQQK